MVQRLLDQDGGGRRLRDEGERAVLEDRDLDRVIRPFACAVWALNALQNSMMLTPCWPSAGPTGGAGLACPPGIWSLMSVRTFFATLFL